MSHSIPTQTRCGRKTTRPKIFEDIDEEDNLMNNYFVPVDKENQSKSISTSKKRKQSEKVVKVELADSNVEVFCCQRCPAKFPSQSSYYYHVNQHGQHPPKKHKCKLCDFSTAYEKNLTGHIELHMQFEKYGTVEISKRPIAKATRRKAMSKSSDSESTSSSVSPPPRPEPVARIPREIMTRKDPSPAPRALPKILKTAPPAPLAPAVPVAQPVKAAVKAVKAPVKAPVLPPNKAPAKVSVIPPVKAPAKLPAKPLSKESKPSVSKTISIPKTSKYVPSKAQLESSKDHWLYTTNFDIPKVSKVKRPAMNHFNQSEFNKARENKPRTSHIPIFGLRQFPKNVQVLPPPSPLMTSSRIMSMNGVCRFKCPKPNCLFKATWERELAEHLDCHGWEAMFKCEKCDYMNDKEDNVQFHQENHHAPEPVK